MLPPGPPRFSTKNCWRRRAESFCDTRRAITSVGPPAGNPTTTRTGWFGYFCASDGTVPVSSNRTAKIQRNTGIVALSPGHLLVGAIIGDGAVRNKGKTSPGPTLSRRIDANSRHRRLRTAARLVTVAVPAVG